MQHRMHAERLLGVHGHHLRASGREAGGHGIRLVLLALHAPSERRSAPALPSPSRLLPPLSPTCFFTHLTSSLPGRARARAGVHPRPRLAGAAGEARRDCGSLRASPSLTRPPPPQHLYPAWPGHFLSAPPRVAPACQTLRILLLPPGLFPPKVPNFLLDFSFPKVTNLPSRPNSNCLDERTTLG